MTNIRCITTKNMKFISKKMINSINESKKYNKYIITIANW